MCTRVSGRQSLSKARRGAWGWRGQCSGVAGRGIRERGRRSCNRGGRGAGGRGSDRAHLDVLETPARAPALLLSGGGAMRPGRRRGAAATAQGDDAGVHGALAAVFNSYN